MTGEYTGPVEAQFSPLEADKLLRPANALFKEPPTTKAREKAVFLLGFEGNRDGEVTDGSDWMVYPDWRGVGLYKTGTGAKFFLEKADINVVPADVGATDIAPGTDTVWDGAAWVLDAVKQRARLVALAAAERDRLLALATAAIAPLQDAVDLDMASGAEQAQLTVLKQYRVALNRIQLQSGYPATIEWPAAPA